MRAIQLTRGMYAFVDDKHYDRLSTVSWYAEYRNHTWYAARKYRKDGKQFKVYMHREIMGNPTGDVDHRNGCGLLNIERNLRACTRRENLRNMKSRGGTSIYKGVSWSASKNKWAAQININGKQTLIGRFISDIEAAKAYDVMAFKHFGEFAKLNFPRTEKTVDI